MRFHKVGFFVGLGLLLCFAEFFDETHGLALQATVEAAAGASVDDVAELGGREVEESVAGLRVILRVI